MLSRLFRCEMPIQEEAADCGYVCIAALLQIRGSTISVPEVKRIVGTASRGLTFRQLRDGFQSLGFVAHVVSFELLNPRCLPVPSILHLSSGHYVTVTRRSRGRLVLFDPASGWRRVKLEELGASGYAIVVDDAPRRSEAAPMFATRRPSPRLLQTPLVLYAAFIGVGAQVGALLVPLAAQKSIDAVIPSSSVSANVAMAFVLVTFLSCVLAPLQVLLQSRLSGMISRLSALELFDRISTQHTEWFRGRSSDYASVQLSALTSVRQFDATVVGQVLGIVILLIFGCAAVFHVSPLMVIPGLVAVGISALLDSLFALPTRRHLSQRSLLERKQRGFLTDIVGQLPQLRRFGGLSGARLALNRGCRELAQWQSRTSRLAALRGAIGQLVGYADRLTFLLLAAYITQSQSLSLGIFVAASLYKDLLAQGLSSVFQLYHRSAAIQPSRNQLRDLLETEGSARLRKAEQLGSGDLRMEGVSYRFGALDPLILSNVFIQAGDGECIVIRGPSGSGKSTILRLACGDLLPWSGKITVDGKSVDVGNPEIASVLQIDRLIDDSIFANIRLLRRNATEDEVLEAARLAGLLEFVHTLPLRGETRVAEGLVGLSAGQRQRILLARALLKRPRVLLLDEATSNLDPESEGNVLRAIRALRTTLVISSHRPGLEEFADRVYEVRDGQAKCVRAPRGASVFVSTRPSQLKDPGRAHAHLEPRWASGGASLFGNPTRSGREIDEAL